MYGYSIKVAEAVRNADESLLGVQLGRKCVERNIPIVDVARTLKVSRQTIYSWFTGLTHPHPHRREAILLWMRLDLKTGD
jgi:hypothetical protein